MPFEHILGQTPAVRTITSALDRGRVHHAYRFEGPDGVGKELCAFALVQALVCTTGGRGCGTCDACKRAVTFSTERPQSSLHPDVVIVEKGFYPPEVIGRSRPELTELSVDQIRSIVLSRAPYPPHEGKARVFIVRRADELSTSAANALLKTLEEPRPGVHFILLTSRGERLLDTIRSRTLPVRFAPLSDDVLRTILASRGVPAERHDLAIELAAGSASAALDNADETKNAESTAFVDAFRAALEARDLGPTVALAESAEKDTLRASLRTLGAALARRARALVAANEARKSAVAAERYDLVANALRALERSNASPNLTVMALIVAMRRAA